MKQDRDPSKKIKIELKSKRLLQKLIKQREEGRVYNISSGQYQSSSGVLGKTTNIQNIYYRKIIERKLHGMT